MNSKYCLGHNHIRRVNSIFKPKIKAPKNDCGFLPIILEQQFFFFVHRFKFAFHYNFNEIGMAVFPFLTSTHKPNLCRVLTGQNILYESLEAE